MSLGNLRADVANQAEHTRLDFVAQDDRHEVAKLDEQYRLGQRHFQRMGRREQGLPYSGRIDGATHEPRTLY